MDTASCSTANGRRRPRSPTCRGHSQGSVSGDIPERMSCYAEDVLQTMLHQESSYAIPAPASNRIHPCDRRKVVQWCKQVVVDYLRLDPSLVDIAMHYTDRHVAAAASSNDSSSGWRRRAHREKQQQQQWTRSAYQLIAMTSVYLAVKLHSADENGGSILDPSLVSRRLARGTYTAEQVEDQERQLLHGLDWKLHPPTASTFLRQYLECIVRGGLLPLLSSSTVASVHATAQKSILAQLEHEPVAQPSCMALATLRQALLRECSSNNNNIHDAPFQIHWALSLLPQPTWMGVAVAPPTTTPAATWTVSPRSILVAPTSPHHCWPAVASMPLPYWTAPEYPPRPSGSNMMSGTDGSHEHGSRHLSFVGGDHRSSPLEDAAPPRDSTWEAPSHELHKRQDCDASR